MSISDTCHMITDHLHIHTSHVSQEEKSGKTLSSPQTTVLTIGNIFNIKQML